ncbi:hypothetical protein NM688_g614 [Phlebia brevispora]|uniref:Uncharacterized protein n=1 Tax=Phlebia brevispora TaxID=194682 RepID=A0ACC1TDZ6_9APHY|nr:hypothetical protein NM688_g614 [Phlebia brevispora]
MAAASTSTDVPPLAKYLASTDKKTRDKAVKNLTIFLSDPSHDALSKTEMAKLWKGIFYCFWMSDKPLVQQALATDLAEILLVIPKTSSSLAFLRGFWGAIVREWNGIDRLRIDKYYMLIRRFINASFRLLMRVQWDSSTLQEYNSILTDSGCPLCPGDVRVPSSLASHIADIYLEELDKSFVTPPVLNPLPAPLSVLLQPLYTMLARTPVNATSRRMEEAVINPLLSALSERPQEEDEDGERIRKRMRLSNELYETLVKNACADSPVDGPLPKAALKRSVLKQIFDTASGEGTRDANRRKLYALVKAHTDDEDEDEDEDNSDSAIKVAMIIVGYVGSHAADVYSICHSALGVASLWRMGSLVPPPLGTPFRRRTVDGNEDVGASLATPGPAGRSKRLRGRRGILKDLPSVPWDVLCEIFSLLDPLDLLKLSRVCKDFRSFLMNKTSAVIWKAARKNIEGLPDCPEDLSEPQYANLMFSNHCHVCLRPCYNEVDWELRERACKKCTFKKANLRANKRVIELMGFPDSVSLVDILSLPLPEFEDSVTPQGLLIFDRMQIRSMEDEYLRDFQERWEKVPQEKREEFIALHTARSVKLKSHGALCKNWYQDRRDAQATRRNDLRVSRQNSIEQKLKEIGWHDEYSQLSYRLQKRFRSLPEVKQPTALTERIWNRISPAIVHFLQTCKDERLSKVKEDVLRTRFGRLREMILKEEPPNRISAPLTYITSLPEVRSNLDQPYNVRVYVEDWRPYLAGWTDNWRHEVSEHLRSLVRQHVDFPAGCNVDPLTLAVGTYWLCPHCKLHIEYPQILAHRCTKYIPGYAPHDDESQYDQVLREVLRYQTIQRLDGLETTAHIVKKIVQLYGLDPAQSTPELMDCLGDRITYLPGAPCHNPDVFYVMTWRSALTHYLESRSLYEAHTNWPAWRKIPAWEAGRYMSQEWTASQAAEAAYLEAETWRCTLCPTLVGSKRSSIVQHLMESHGEQEPKDHILLWSHRSCVKHIPLELPTSEAVHDDPQQWDVEEFESDTASLDLWQQEHSQYWQADILPFCSVLNHFWES